MGDQKAEKPRATIAAPDVLAYLDELVRLGIYGTQPGPVATWIVRKEIMRLIEAKVLQPIRIVPAGPARDEEG